MRHLYYKITEDSWFLSLTIRQRLAWMTTITCLADDQGRFRYHPTDLRFFLFPNDNVSDDEIMNRMEVFLCSKKIIYYRCEQENFCQIMNWWRYQNVSRTMNKSYFPAPKGWMDRWNYVEYNHRQMVSGNWDKGQAGFSGLQPPNRHSDRIRHIDEGIFLDRWYGSLSEIQRYAWILIINSLADDQGRFALIVESIRKILFPADTIPDEDIIELINGFVCAGKIIMYEMGGRRYCQIVKWWKYQNPMCMGKSHLPAPIGWQDHFVSYMNAEMQR